MKVTELFESGSFKGHTYVFGNYPTSRDRGLAALYNTIIPNMSRIFKIPVANFKVQSDHRLPWIYTSRSVRPYSTERCLMQVLLRKKSLNADLISSMLPKLLRAELSKHFVDVDVSDVKLLDPTQHHVPGFDLPLRIQLSFRTKYPPDWLKWDKERYGIK